MVARIHLESRRLAPGTINLRLGEWDLVVLLRSVACTAGTYSVDNLQREQRLGTTGGLLVECNGLKAMGPADPPTFVLMEFLLSSLYPAVAMTPCIDYATTRVRSRWFRDPFLRI
jgi:hypothetical protein